jgi:hypothetical protein
LPAGHANRALPVDEKSQIEAVERTYRGLPVKKRLIQLCAMSDSIRRAAPDSEIQISLTWSALSCAAVNYPMP